MKLCTGGAMCGYQCPHEVMWRNQNNVEVCEHHKLLLEAFTWENRNTRKWERMVNNEKSKY